MQSRPDVVFICKHLLMLVAELRKAGDGGVRGAVEDLRRKLRKGLPASQYRELPYLPAVAQSGTCMQLCKVQRNGQVTSCFVMLDSSLQLAFACRARKPVPKQCQHYCAQAAPTCTNLCQYERVNSVGLI